jgi:hypothetical protein
VQLTKGGEIELTEEEAIELSSVGYIDPSQIPVKAFRPIPVPIVPVVEAEVEVPARKKRAKAA